MSGVAPTPSVHYEVLDYFEFWPSRGPIYLAYALYGIATLLIVATTIYTRRWYMLIGAAVGIMELIGFAFRLVMLTNPVYGYYVGMQCLLIIPPSFLALVEYITLGNVVKLVRQVNPEISDFLKPKLITWLYFAAEIASLAMQGAGAGLSVSHDGPPSSGQAGKILLILGLAFLVVIIATFLTNAIYVNVRSEYGIRKSRDLQALFTILYLTTFLLLIRNVFRLVEFAGGFYGSIATKEKYFYTLDSLMVVLILFSFGLFNYGFFLNAFERKIAVKRFPNETEIVWEGYTYLFLCCAPTNLNT